MGQSQNTDFDGQIADTSLALITYVILTLNKRFDAYETTGALFRHIQQELLELTLYEHLRRILSKIVLVIVDLFGIDLNEGMERMIKDDRVPRQLCSMVHELNSTLENPKYSSNLDIETA